MSLVDVLKVYLLDTVIIGVSSEKNHNLSIATTTLISGTRIFSKAYSKPSQTTKIVLFGGAFCENSQRNSAINYFRKKFFLDV